MSMRTRNRSRAAAAIITGSVVMMTGCSQPALEGEELYRAAEQRYFPLAEGMHVVLMALHEGDWKVSSFGAEPRSCALDAGGSGYFLDYARSVALEDLDIDALSDAAVGAFDTLGITATVTTFGSGGAQERNVIAEADAVGRAVVTIRPGRGEVQVVARTPCSPGNAHDLATMIYGEERLPLDVSERLPEVEGPDSVPQFSFPAAD